jgi:hypothetical protein
MNKEFESELAKRVAGKKKSSKVWVVVALCAAVLMSGAMAVTVVAADDKDQIKDKTMDKLQDGSCTDSDCVPDLDGDGICDCDTDGDGICDCAEDCTCVDCPCCTA